MQTVNIAFDTGGIISLLVGFVLPLVVGYFTNESMNSGLKAAILAALAGLTSVLSQWLSAIDTHTHFAWQSAVLGAVATWITAEFSYVKLVKPSGLSDVLQAAGPIADAPTSAPKHAATDAVTQDQIDEATPVVTNPNPKGINSVFTDSSTPTTPLP